MRVYFFLLLLTTSSCFADTNRRVVSAKRQFIKLGRSRKASLQSDSSYESYGDSVEYSTTKKYNQVRSKITIRLYYESLCPDTIRFVKEQLAPAVNLLEDYLHIVYIPWGIANSTSFGFGGFKCQHGAKECLGNMIQECVFAQMRSRSEKDKSDYLLCEMRQKSASQGKYECVRKATVSESAVKSCAKSNEGKQLQLTSETMTKRLDPVFIPTVTFNGAYNQELQDASMKDFIATLCTELQRPKECLEHYNRMALRHLLERSGSLSRTLFDERK